MEHRITLLVNGQGYAVSVATETTLLDVLRRHLHLTSAKDGCRAGECGACTVILDGQAVNACLVLAVECSGSEVQTVEGLADDGRLHPLQEAFINCGAVQCGFCTPGMLMSAKALLDQNPDPSLVEVKAALRGNLCRCTGYKKIEEAVLQAARQMRGEKR